MPRQLLSFSFARRTLSPSARHEAVRKLLRNRIPIPYSGNPLHPTQKAVEVLEPIINAFTKPGASILDPFMGSGSTGAAAVRTKRHFTGIELERSHYDTALHRLRQA